MAPTKKLARVLADEIKEGYRLTFEAMDGEVFRIIATEDQLNDLADEIDELLGDDVPEELTEEQEQEQERVGEEQPS